MRPSQHDVYFLYLILSFCTYFFYSNDTFQKYDLDTYPNLLESACFKKISNFRYTKKRCFLEMIGIYQTFTQGKICVWKIGQSLQKNGCGDIGLEEPWIELVTGNNEMSHYTYYINT